MQAPFRRPVNSDSSRLGTRLEGWKTIASYLDKAERTVKRWEVDRGVPVHRVPGGGRAVVYCIATELDAWLESNRTYAEGSHSSPETEPPPTSDIPDSNAHAPAREIRLSRSNQAFSSFIVRRRLFLTAIGVLALCVTSTALHYTGTKTSDLRVFGPAKSGKANSQPTSSTTVTEADKVLAQDLYLKGRFEWNKRTAESLNRALDDFTQSIVHDPSSAHTYAGLADTYLLLHEYSLLSDHEATSRAIAASTKAVELDDSLAEAHRSLAFAQVWGNWNFPAGEREFRRAIQLDPRDALTHLWFATAFNTLEWSSVTRNEFDRAQELDPSSPIVLANKSIWLFQTGQRQAGLDLALQVEQDDPDFVAPHRYLARMNWSLRNYQAFLIESEKTADLTHDPLLKKTIATANLQFRSHGERGLLESLYVSRKKLYDDGRLAGTPLAEICVRQGKKEEALRLVQSDYANHRAEFLWTLTDPDLMTLKSDPHYQQLLVKLNFPPPPAPSK